MLEEGKNEMDGALMEARPIHKKKTHRIVTIPAVRLLQHERYFKVVDKQELGSAALLLVLGQLTFGSHFLNDGRNFVIVKGLAAFRHGHIESLIDLVKFATRNVAEQLPNAQTFGIP